MNHNTFDYTNWRPLSVEKVLGLLSGLDIFWCFAGGYAIELFVGKPIRNHGDIDILIKRTDQLKLQEHLAHWELYWATKPGLKRWEQDEWISEGFYDIWCRSDEAGPWQLQIMLFDTEGEHWLFKRDPKIRKPVSSIFQITRSGIPYLCPEIQLLYKAKAKTIEKDKIDFDAVSPLLDQSARLWLIESLQKCFPEGHGWIKKLG